MLGTFTLTHGLQTTPALAFDATAVQVQAALVALSSIVSATVAFSTGSAACSGTGVGMVVTFTGSIVDEAPLTKDLTLLVAVSTGNAACSGTGVGMVVTFTGSIVDEAPLTNDLTLLGATAGTIDVVETFKGSADADESTTSATRRAAQRRCPAGWWCESGLRARCPAGRYGATEGLRHSRCTGFCAAGYACPAGSTSETASPCPAGYYSTKGAGKCSKVGAAAATAAAFAAFAAAFAAAAPLRPPLLPASARVPVAPQPRSLLTSLRALPCFLAVPGHDAVANAVPRQALVLWQRLIGGHTFIFIYLMQEPLLRLHESFLEKKNAYVVTFIGIGSVRLQLQHAALSHAMRLMVAAASQVLSVVCQLLRSTT
jgi:hypothetical protein